MNLGELAKRTVLKTMEKLRVSIPAEVQSYEPETGLADVAIKIPKPFANGDFETSPIIPEMPVMFPCAGVYSIQYPIATGTKGLIVFCDYEISAWAHELSNDAPQSKRYHALSDGVFIPMSHACRPNTAQGLTLKSATGLMELKDGTATFKEGASQIVLTSSNVEITGTQVLINGINFNTHTHTGGTINGITGAPNQ